MFDYYKLNYFNLTALRIFLGILTQTKITKSICPSKGQVCHILQRKTNILGILLSLNSAFLIFS